MAIYGRYLFFSFCQTIDVTRNDLTMIQGVQPMASLSIYGSLLHPRFLDTESMPFSTVESVKNTSPQVGCNPGGLILL